MNEDDRAKKLDSKALAVRNWISSREDSVVIGYFFNLLLFFVLVIILLLILLPFSFLMPAKPFLILLPFIISIVVVAGSLIRDRFALVRLRKQPLNIRAKQIMQAWEVYEGLVDKVHIWKKAVELGECPNDPEYAASCQTQLESAETDLLSACDIFLKYAELDKLERDFRKTNPNSAFVGEANLAQSLAQLRLPLATPKYRVTEADVRAEQTKLLAVLASSPDHEEVELAEKIDNLKIR